MPLRGSVSSSLAQTGSFGRMQGRRLATQFLNVKSGSFGRVIATNFVGDGSQLTNVPVDLPAGVISSSNGTLHVNGLITQGGVGSGAQNIFIGGDAGGAPDNTGTVRSVIIGAAAASKLTTGDYAVAIGYKAGGATDTATGDHNNFVAIGSSAGSQVKTNASRFVMIGPGAGSQAISPSNSVLIGFNAGALSYSGSANILIGYQAGQNMGNSAGETPNNNIAIGLSAMESAGDATFNVAVGDNALKNIIGSNNVAIGDQALKDHIDGDSNVAIGYQAMGDAGQDGKTLDYTIAIGTSTLQQLETGNHNIAIGRESQRAIITGSNNITIGYRTLFQENDVIGSGNIVIGSNAGYNANGSSFHANVVIGDNAGYQATNRENVLIGEYAGNDLEDGSQNVVIGANAARFSNTFQSNTNSVLIGHRTQASADGNENENVFGYNATGKGSNSVTIGNASITDIYLSQDIGAQVHTGNVSGSAVSTASFGRFEGSAAGLTDIPVAPPTFTDKIIQTGVGGSDNIIIGDSNTFSAQIDGGLTTSRRNVIIGADSGQYITTGDQNTVVGNEAMKGSDGNGDQASNVAIGYYTLRVNQADSNTAVGSQAGQSTTTGAENTFIGQGAGASNTTGQSNTYIGAGAGGQINNPTTALGKNNVMVGAAAGGIGRAATDTVIIGRSAGRGTKQQGSIIIGKEAGFFLTSGSNNIIMGVQTAYSGGDNNSNSNTAYQKNVFIGDAVAKYFRKGGNNVVLGTNALSNYRTGSNNFVVGYRAGFNNAGTGTRDFGTNNIAFGGYAMSGDSTNFNGGDHNFFVGYQAGYQATNCDYTVALGYKAGYRLGDGSDKNTFLGFQAGLNFKDGDENIALGPNAFNASDSGSQNIAIGSYALNGSEGVASNIFTTNIAIGSNAIGQMKSGANNIGIGNSAFSDAGANGEDLDNNIAIGQMSLDHLEKGDDNIAIGTQAMETVETGSYNIAIGKHAMYQANNEGGAASLSTDQNVVIGYQAARNLQNASANVIIGSSAGLSLGTDEKAIDSNVAIGGGAFQEMEEGNGNIVLGPNAMQDATSGSNNIAMGSRAMNCDVGTDDAGDYNVALGVNSMYGSEGGQYNVAIGYEALYHVDGVGSNEGEYNVAIGRAAGRLISTGRRNICVGQYAGDAIQTGNHNLVLGYSSDVSAEDVTDELIIGQSLVGAGTETIRIGLNTDHITNDFGENATWTHSSDKRIKKDIEDNSLGLEFINKLKTRTFKKKAPSEYPTEFDGYDAEVTERKNPNRKHYGFVAQEVKEAMDSVGHSEFPVWKENPDGMQELGETELITPLIKAVQELTKKVEEQQKEIDKLRNQNG